MAAKSNLATRLLTAGVGIPVILGLLYLGPPWAFLVVISIAAAIAAFELYGMTNPGDRVMQTLGAVLVVGVIYVLWTYGTDARVLLTLLLLVPLLAQILVLWRLGEMKTAALRVTAGAFSPLYVGGGLGVLALLRRDAGDDGAGFVVLAFTLSWLSDTGAYFAGRFLGRNKLYEAVSPKKTREGALGGLAGAVVGALAGHFFYLQSLPLLDAIVLGVVAGGLGQVGDLGESLLKRSVDVKDSGGIVPGHGGILDRVDALMVTGALSFLYVMWLRP